jgi:hypothetical protein
VPAASKSNLMPQSIMVRLKELFAKRALAAAGGDGPPHFGRYPKSREPV